MQIGCQPAGLFLLPPVNSCVKRAEAYVLRMDVHHDYIPLPEIFWSFETGQPMEHCSLCGCDLMVPDTNYLIEKAFKNRETVFEHALCLKCYTDAHESLSAARLMRSAAM